MPIAISSLCPFESLPSANAAEIIKRTSGNKKQSNADNPLKQHSDQMFSRTPFSQESEINLHTFAPRALIKSNRHNCEPFARALKSSSDRREKQNIWFLYFPENGAFTGARSRRNNRNNIEPSLQKRHESGLWYLPKNNLKQKVFDWQNHTTNTAKLSRI